VFISHDHRDAALAEAFSELLSEVSGGFIESFRSSDQRGTNGIEFGTEWYSAVMNRLDQATNVVALLTRNSVDRPWILYEAGVAKGKLHTPVLGVAIGISLQEASRGPFAQFQNSDDSEASLTKLVRQLIEGNMGSHPSDAGILRQVQAFTAKVENLLPVDSVGDDEASRNTDDVDSGAVAKLFEEIKAMFAELPERLRKEFSATLNGMPHRIRRRHSSSPSQLLERLHNAANSEDPDVFTSAWLLVCSLFREETPSAYESGIEVYRALSSRNRMRIGIETNRFRKAVKFVDPGMLEEILGYDRGQELYFILRSLSEILSSFVRDRFPRTSTSTNKRFSTLDVDDQ